MFSFFSQRLTKELQQYALITANYWAFTLTDGALRMLVVLYFHQLGYNPLQIAMLFLFYELFGVFTNLIGGWLGSRWGLNRTMHLGLGLQVIALSLLVIPGSLVSSEWFTVAWVMFAQALSGIAKDLNKMSAKSAVKLLVPENQQDKLYRWVAILTGSKNTLKGVGFFLGGVLLTMFGFQSAVLTMAVALSIVWLISIFALNGDLGKAKNKIKFSQIFSKSRNINWLSAARLFLFAARDVWFVVALPVFLSTKLGWTHWQVGTFLAAWIIAYGFVQGIAPKLTGVDADVSNHTSNSLWCLALSVVPVMMVSALMMLGGSSIMTTSILIVGLGVFGFFFAVNSALHSYLIIRLANADSVSTDVGFYYMANASGRLLGTVLSGYVFQVYGFNACLMISALFIVISTLLVRNIE